MTKNAVVIIPTTGADTLIQTIESVAKQTYNNVTAHIVVDGKQFASKVRKMLLGKGFQVPIRVEYLDENVGAGGFYGHRIYAAYSHLVNEDYVFFLDQDNWFEPNHVETMIAKLELTKSDWVYSLRNICDKEGNFICQDNCESLGKWEAWTNCYHIDTNCYCFTNKVAVTIAGAWHGGWGQDRVVFQALKQYFPNFACSGNYSVNYRLDGNTGSVTKDFFVQGNAKMQENYKNYPWSKNES
jgi:glycosyltransferase involved in cell wall biosynthesis